MNGIPFCVIECKAPHVEVQNDDYIPRLQEFVNRPLEKDIVSKITATIGSNPSSVEVDRLVTEQDKALYSSCCPERLLELTWKGFITRLQRNMCSQRASRRVNCWVRNSKETRISLIIIFGILSHGR